MRLLLHWVLSSPPLPFRLGQRLAECDLLDPLPERPPGMFAACDLGSSLGWAVVSCDQRGRRGLACGQSRGGRHKDPQRSDGRKQFTSLSGHLSMSTTHPNLCP